MYFAIPDTILRLVVPQQKSSALEIGCFKGETTVKLAALFDRVTCVDPWDDDYVKEKPGFSYSPSSIWVGQFEKFCAATGAVSHKLDIQRGKSQEILPTLPDKTYDFIFVDGDHSTAAVGFDAQQCHRLIRAGGVILFDDYSWRGTEGPQAAIDEFVQMHQSVYVVVHQCSRFVALLRVSM